MPCLVFLKKKLLLLGTPNNVPRYILLSLVTKKKQNHAKSTRQIFKQHFSLSFNLRQTVVQIPAQ